jgi:hypothetical protein
MKVRLTLPDVINNSYYYLKQIKGFQPELDFNSIATSCMIQTSLKNIVIVDYF